MAIRFIKKNFDELAPSKNQLRLIENMCENWGEKYRLEIRFSPFEDSNSYTPENKSNLFKEGRYVPEMYGELSFFQMVM